MLPQPLRAVLVGVALSLAGGAVIPAQQPSGGVATTLRAEYLVDPLAHRRTRPAPELDHRCRHTHAASPKRAYQIRVASTAANLAADKADLWDSGKIASNRQNQIEYEGAAAHEPSARLLEGPRLGPDRRSRRRGASPRSWSMGLLDQSDWSAQLDWRSDAPRSTNVAATMLRRRFTLAASAGARHRLRDRARRVRASHQRPARRRPRARARVHRLPHAHAVPGVRRHVAAPPPATTSSRRCSATAGTPAVSAWRRRSSAKPRNIYGDHPRFLAQLEVDARRPARRRTHRHRQHVARHARRARFARQTF